MTLLDYSSDCLKESYLNDRKINFEDAHQLYYYRL